MATATRNDWAHAWLRIREWARVWYDLRKYTSDTLNADQFYAALEQIVTNDGCLFDPDVDQGQKIAVLAQRALVAGLLSGGRSLLDPLMLQLSRAMGYPQQDPVQVFPILYRYMAINQGAQQSAPMVTSRAFTRGGWTAGGSNVGTGTVLRLTVDQYGNPLEADAPDIWNFRCVADNNSGTNPGAEQFSVLGEPFRDALSRYTTGYSIGVGNQIPAPSLVGVEGVQTQTYIQNPSFAAWSGTGASASFALTGWTIDVPTQCQVSTTATDIYRSSAVETTAGGLKVNANGVTTNISTTIPAGKLQAFLAYMCQLAVNFSQNSGTGSVELKIGTGANAIDVTVNSGAGGWNLLRPTINKALYYANFAPSATIPVLIKVIGTSGAGTFIVVDDLNFGPWQSIAGKLLWGIGSATNWVVNDTATMTDSVAVTNAVPTTGLVQTMISEVYGQWLPAYTPSTQPGASTVAGTGGGTTAAGQYAVCVTFYNGTTKLESAPSAEQTIILDGTTNTRIALTNVPTGPAGTTKRLVYVSQANDYNSTRFTSVVNPESAMYFVGSINDNAGTSITVDPATATISLAGALAYAGDI